MVAAVNAAIAIAVSFFIFIVLVSPFFVDFVLFQPVFIIDLLVFLYYDKKSRNMLFFQDIKI